MFIDDSQEVSPETETELETEEVIETDEVAEDPEDNTDWEAEAKKWKAIASRKEKKLEKTETKQATPVSSLSIEDTLYLAKADIAAEDVKEVLEYASRMGTSVQQAHAFYRPILSQREEERRTAQTTSTRSARGTAKPSGEDLLARAERTNALPDTDEGMAAIFEARRARQFKR